MTAMRQYWQLNIFPFIFDENAETICGWWWEWKEGEEKVVIFFSMAIAMAMLTMTAITTTTTMIDYCSLHQSNGMIAGIIYFSFYIRWKWEGEFLGDKGNGRREGKSGLIFCNGDGDGNHNGNKDNSNDWLSFVSW
jgi:hypothetical protein